MVAEVGAARCFIHPVILPLRRRRHTSTNSSGDEVGDVGLGEAGVDHPLHRGAQVAVPAVWPSCSGLAGHTRLRDHGVDLLDG